MLSQCYPIVLLNGFWGTAVIDTLCVCPVPPSLSKGVQEAYYRALERGQLLWHFGRDSYSSVSPTYVERDRLNGNISVTYVTLLPSKREWRRTSRRHSRWTRLMLLPYLFGFSTKTWRWKAPAAHYIPAPWGEQLLHMIACQCALALFSYTRSRLASLARFLFVGQSEVHLRSLLQGTRVTYVKETFFT